MALILLIFALPLLLWMACAEPKAPRQVEDAAKGDVPPIESGGNELMRDSRFYRTLSALLVLPFVLTAVPPPGAGMWVYRRPG